MANDEDLPRAGHPVTTLADQQKWYRKKSLKFTLTTLMQFLNLTPRQMKVMMSETRVVLRRDTTATAVEDRKNDTEEKPYVKAGERLKAWMLPFDTQINRRASFLHVTSQMKHHFPQHFMPGPIAAADEPGWNVWNEHHTANRPDEPPTYQRPAYDVRIELMKRLIMQQAHAMHVDHRLRSADTEDEVEVFWVQMKAPPTHTTTAAHTTPAQWSKRKIRIYVDVGNGVKVPITKTVNELKQDGNEDQLDYEKLYHAVEEVINEHATPAWNGEWSLEWRDVNGVRYEVTFQMQVDAAILIDEKAVKPPKEHVFYASMTAAPQDVQHRRWPDV